VLEDLYLYQNKNALPLAYLTTEISPVSSEAEISGMLRMDGPVMVLGEHSIHDRSPLITRARTQWHTEECLGVDIESDQSGYLVLSVPYMPGWHALDSDGFQYEIHQTDLALMGMYIQAGQHHISLCYEPRGATTGSCIWILALIISTILLMYSRRDVYQARGELHQR
jgi:hypothetical protein